MKIHVDTCIHARTRRYTRTDTDSESELTLKQAFASNDGDVLFQVQTADSNGSI
jgi:hypothetical protein